ncbi:unnamed protein product [Lepeophtheirus salmonis]|uniref:(salmon louse) hypothetical protein n=1 Tax=Lepeophtheirus salmonis TaxID=72036 RepID=A0A7R8HEP6_LEPSM|nr:unnamed protein product [Lepeophtheirus salmonis]CAF3031675.1 unnamed protein product [Lepeophtheirus salmonis]
MLYADDTVLLADSLEKLQIQLNRFIESAVKVGLLPNALKSCTLNIQTNPGRKEFFVAKEPFATMNGVKVPTVSVGAAYKYLGLKVTHEGYAQSDVLGDYQYQLTRGRYSKGYLSSINREVEKFVRSNLGLFHDTTKSFINAAIASSGLGIKNLEDQITLLRVERRGKLESSPYPSVRLASTSVRKMLSLKSPTVNGVECKSQSQYSSLKGKGAL